MGILVNFLGEGSLEIREKAKNLLTNILVSERGPEMMRLVPGEHLNKLKIRQFKPEQVE